MTRRSAVGSLAAAFTTIPSLTAAWTRAQTTPAPPPTQGDEPVETDVYVAGQDGYHTFRIPSVILTTKGTLLAFAEARRAGRSDAGDIDLVVKRSTDGGATWSAHEGDRRQRAGHVRQSVSGDRSRERHDLAAHDAESRRGQGVADPRRHDVEFDTRTLSPTFRLRYDVPGQSYALAIAGRLGLSPELIALAQNSLHERRRAHEPAPGLARRGHPVRGRAHDRHGAAGDREHRPAGRGPGGGDHRRRARPRDRRARQGGGRHPPDRRPPRRERRVGPAQARRAVAAGARGEPPPSARDRRSGGAGAGRAGRGHGSADTRHGGGGRAPGTARSARRHRRRLGHRAGGVDQRARARRRPAPQCRGPAAIARPVVARPSCLCGPSRPSSC